MAVGQPWLPNLPAGTAYTEEKCDVQQVEDRKTPNYNMDCKEHSHVGFSGRDKNSQVLEEDREFDKENSKGVDDRLDIDILGF